MACKEDEEQWRRGSEEELLGRALPSPRLTFTAHAHVSCILVKHRLSARTTVLYCTAAIVR